VTSPIDRHDPELIHDFLIESNESLERIDRELLALEHDPSLRETLTSVFRSFHTIKGNAGFLGFTKLQELTHAVENLLSGIRDGNVVLDTRIVSTLLAAADAVREVLRTIEQTSDEGALTHDALVKSLAALHVCQVTRATGDLPDDATLYSRERTSKELAVAASNVRVEIGVLDGLMNLVGELVLARNQLVDSVAGRNDPRLTSTCQRLSAITTELQDSVMKTRMQPISMLWGKLPRVVRDLASRSGKKVSVELEGGETELDRAIIDAIRDPLTHIVRNAIDHGIETPAARVAAGKPEQGLLRLQAFHAGSQVHV
jgi:two-component system, chemotaxis family, sensor kinase CheA